MLRRDCCKTRVLTNEQRLDPACPLPLMGRVEKILFTFRSHQMAALENGALWWPAQDLLVVSDLHLGKAERLARRGGGMLPPYETTATLDKLDDALAASSPRTVICLGDSFDDLDAASNLETSATDRLERMAAGRRWVWITGNHDPGPVSISGEHKADMKVADITFRHEAARGAKAEISGHYHPKAWLDARGSRRTRPAFLFDSDRMILPAMGQYTGGLRCTEPALSSLLAPNAVAILTGAPMLKVPMPRAAVR